MDPVVQPRSGCTRRDDPDQSTTARDRRDHASEFSGLDDSPRDLWVPLTMYHAVAKLDLFGPSQPREMVLTARLREGVGAPQAEGALTSFMTAVSGRPDAVQARVLPRATPAPLSFELIATLAPVFAAFGLVLVAACANVSNVMLARANARHRENRCAALARGEPRASGAAATHRRISHRSACSH